MVKDLLKKAAYVFDFMFTLYMMINHLKYLIYIVYLMYLMYLGVNYFLPGAYPQ